MRKTSILVVFVVSAFAEIPSLFEYDAKQPLDFREAGNQDRPNAVIHDVSYASPRGGRVPAYLITPKYEGMPAGIVWMHWGQGDRSSFLAEALILAQRGAASILIDAPFLRPREGRPQAAPFADPEAERDSWAQAVVELRRGVDVLLAHANVDLARLGYVGHSYGATLGGAIAASEPRFKVLVLMGGFCSQTDVIRRGEGAMGSYARTAIPAGRLDRYVQILAPLDAINYVGKVRQPLLFQFAHHDRYITEREANVCIDAAGPDKTVKWYDGGHELNHPQAQVDRDEWLAARLDLRKTDRR